jgi:hypothetical protein
VCIIIDANLASRVFGSPRPPDYAPLWRWIEEADGVIVYGGKLAGELNRIEAARRYLHQLYSAGKAHREPDDNVRAEEDKIAGKCRSDDPHVIALARLTGARVLCSADTDLHDDFKNLALVPRPKGRVYQTAKHARVLGHTPNCVGRPK